MGVQSCLKTISLTEQMILAMDICQWFMILRHLNLKHVNEKLWNLPCHYTAKWRSSGIKGSINKGNPPFMATWDYEPLGPLKLLYGIRRFDHLVLGKGSVVAIICWKHKDTFIFCIISQHWDSTDYWNPFLWKTGKFIHHSQYHGRQWLVNTRHQQIWYWSIPLSI